MQDPTIFGDPDRMQSPLYYLGTLDHGGVHTNSGVNNKAAYLMVDGDTFNNVTVVGIGIDKVAQIYYNTQTTKLIPTSNYADLYDALQQSCTELIGQFDITAEDCESVTGAVTATEMNLPAGVPTNVEILDNGGFEATDARATRASVLDPWTVKNAVGDKIKCDTETKIVAHSGVCAWRFKGGAGESTKLQQVIDLTGLTFASGDTVDLSAFLNSPKAGSTGKVKVVVAYSDNTESGKFKDSFGVNSTYTELTGSVNVTTSAVSKIKVMFINKSPAGKAYLDDVSLLQTFGSTALPIPVALPQTQIQLAPASSGSPANLSGNNQISR
jgi:hypothetical protein